MKRKTLVASFAALLACGVLVSGMVGCGASNHLQSITLSVALVNGQAPSNQNGFFSLLGAGGTIQLKATGNYSNEKPLDLTSKVTYTVVVDPVHGVDDLGAALLPPCTGSPCPVPAAPPYTNGTVQFSPTGLLTAVQPSACSWVNMAVDPAPNPAWFVSGDYMVTATLGGVTSQPVFIPVASQGGIYDQYSNPNSACGPGT